MKSLILKVFLVFAVCVFFSLVRYDLRTAEADPRSAVALPVQSVDSQNNILGTATNPAYFIAGSPADGGTAASGVSIVNDAGNPVPSDPTSGDFLNTRYVSNAAATAGNILDAGTTAHLVSCNFYNAGTVAAFGDIFCGQSVLDAGGTNDAGTVPSVQVPCPAGTLCAWQMPSSSTCGAGANWYSSSTVGLLTVDAGQQSMAVECIYR